MDNANDKAFEQGIDFLKMWTQMMSNMGSAGFDFRPGDTPPDAYKKMRGAMFDAMGKSFEDYMRSPQFLEGMKQQMDAAIAFRKQINEWLTTAQHETQKPAREDVERVDRRLMDLERDLGSRIDEVGSKLDAVIEMLSRSNGSGAARTGAKKAKKSKKPAKKRATRKPA